MTELTLKRSGRRLEDHYDVIAAPRSWAASSCSRHSNCATFGMDHSSWI
jgi:hypothetical protein